MNVFLVQHKIMPDGEYDFPPKLRISSMAVIGVFSTEDAAETADQSARAAAVDPAGFFRVSEISQVTVDEFHPAP